MSNEAGLQGQVTVFGHRGGFAEPIDSISDAGLESLAFYNLGITNRFAGGKTAYVGTLTASGDNTIIAAPGVGQQIVVYWVSAMADPDQATAPLIRVLFGDGTEIYRGFTIAHWERFDGAENQALIVNLSETTSVAVTVHYLLEAV